jgi:hypothetical protein
VHVARRGYVFVAPLPLRHGEHVPGLQSVDWGSRNATEKRS